MKILLVGHDNFGSREIFSEIVKENPDQQFVLFITTGLYYRKTFIQSVWKMLKEASFWFCFLRFVDLVIYRFQNDTMKKRARALNIPTYFTDDVNSTESLKIARDHGVDLMASMFTMHIHKAEIISAFKHGSIGTHPALLPTYRGLEVFFWQLCNEEKESGVSVFYLSPKVDQGKIFMQEKFPITPTESVESIYEKLTHITARMMASAIRKIANGEKIEILFESGKGDYYPMPTSESFRKFLKTKHTWFSNRRTVS